MPTTTAVPLDQVQQALQSLLADPLCVQRGLGAKIGRQFKVSAETGRNYLKDLLGPELYKQDIDAWRRALHSGKSADPTAYTPPPFADEHQRNLAQSRAAYRAEVNALLCRLLAEELPKTRIRRRVVKANAKNRVYRITQRYLAFLAIKQTPKIAPKWPDLGTIQSYPHYCQKPKNLHDFGGDWGGALFAAIVCVGSILLLVAAIWHRSGQAYGVLSMTVAIIGMLLIAVWQTG